MSPATFYCGYWDITCVRLASTAERGSKASFWFVLFFKTVFLCVIEPWLSWTHCVEQAGLGTQRSVCLFLGLGPPHPALKDFYQCGRQALALTGQVSIKGSDSANTHQTALLLRAQHLHRYFQTASMNLKCGGTSAGQWYCCRSFCRKGGGRNGKGQVDKTQWRGKKKEQTHTHKPSNSGLQQKKIKTQAF